MRRQSLGIDRRTFLKSMALFTAGASKLALAGQLPPENKAPVVSTSPWAKKVGLELYSVRDLMTDPKSYVATLEKVAAIGYKEIEPANGYAGMTPRQFRSLLDNLGLSMPSTHSGATEGPDLEKQLEGFQIMGIKYTEVYQPSPGRGGSFASYLKPKTSDEVKRTADELNKNGEVVKKFGMKVLLHNHTPEFAPLIDNPDMKPYDILLANTDPSLVAMQLDIGWAVQAGQDPIALFKKSPGRFELWHVKDFNDITTMNPATDEAKRLEMGVTAIVPIGLGDIDYKPIFALAGLAGMKHFCVEQDSAAAWGDSIAAVGVCYKNLVRLLG